MALVMIIQKPKDMTMDDFDNIYNKMDDSFEGSPAYDVDGDIFLSETLENQNGVKYFLLLVGVGSEDNLNYVILDASKLSILPFENGIGSTLIDI